MIRILGIAALLFVALPHSAAGQQPLRTDPDDQGVMILQGDLPVLRYQRTTKSLEGKWPRANYVHPLFDLDGKVISEDFPPDHRHHRGVFWAWHQVWVGDRKLGDPWTCERFIWDVPSVNTSGEADSLSIAATVLWKSPDYLGDDGKMIPVVREDTMITAHPQTNRYRLIEFEISLLAIADNVKIGGSEDVKGYGGFAPRIQLNGRQRFVSGDGDVQPVKQAIQAGLWINITDDQRGIAILSHATNPPPNDLWILRSKGSMQNAVYPGRQPVSLSRVEPTVLKYQLVIHRGDLTAAEITKLQQDFE